MKKTVVLLLLMSVLTAFISGCKPNTGVSLSDQSNISYTSQDMASEVSEQSSQVSASNQGEISLKEKKQKIAEELKITHPYSQQYGVMQNGYGGLETAVYETEHVRMEYPVVSDGEYSKDMDTRGEIIPDAFGTIAFGSGIKQNLKEYPKLFLSRFDLESEGTFLDMTYRIVQFDEHLLVVKYFGSYRNAEGETEPVLFFVNLDADGFGERLTIDNLLPLVSLPTFLVDQNSSFHVYSSAYVEQNAAKDYVNSWNDLEKIVEVLFETGVPGSNEGVDNHPMSNLFTWTTDDTIELIITNLPKEAGYWMRISIPTDQTGQSKYHVSSDLIEKLMESWEQ